MRGTNSYTWSIPDLTFHLIHPLPPLLVKKKRHGVQRHMFTTELFRSFITRSPKNEIHYLNNSMIYWSKSSKVKTPAILSTWHWFRKCLDVVKQKSTVFYLWCVAESTYNEAKWSKYPMFIFNASTLYVVTFNHWLCIFFLVLIREVCPSFDHSG